MENQNFDLKNIVKSTIYSYTSFKHAVEESNGPQDDDTIIQLLLTLHKENKILINGKSEISLTKHIHLNYNGSNLLEFRNAGEITIL